MRVDLYGPNMSPQAKAATIFVTMSTRDPWSLLCLSWEKMSCALGSTLQPPT
jgi:hypothetical protein